MRRLFAMIAAFFVSAGAIATTIRAVDRFRAEVAVPDTAPPPSDEFREQVASIIRSYRAGDATAGRKLIEQFRLPEPENWFSQHFDSERGAELAKRYERLYDNFAESFEHTVEAIVGNRDAELVTSLEKGDGETPTGIHRPGAKLSGMVSIKAPMLFYGKFAIAVQRKNTTSWGDTFVQEDGRFRFVGTGGWPFWVWQEGTEGAAPAGGAFSTPPILIARVNPTYPPEARSKRIEGTVVVHLLIDKEGQVKKMDVSNGNSLLAPAALEAVRQWRYKPATLGGRPIDSEVTANVDFSLH